MFESVMQSTTSSLKISSSILSILLSLILGAVICGVYIYTSKKKYSQGFALTLIILPAGVTAVIMLVGTNIASAFSIAGVFSLVRFRSAPGEAKDIMYIFLTMALGLSSGMGYLSFAIFIVLILCAVMIILSKISIFSSQKNEKLLKITIPEDLNYENAFDDLFEKFTTTTRLDRVKTINMGTLFELSYTVNIKNDTSEKEFIDQLRCRNGNLTINLLLKEENSSVSL